MIKCSKCGKPLTEFEVMFHQKVKSPPEIACKCWSCSGADDEFRKAYVSIPNHRVPIIACLMGLAAIFLWALISYLIQILQGEYFDTFWEFFGIFFGNLPEEPIYHAITIIPTIFVRRWRSKRQLPSELLDPPEKRYGQTYAPTTTEYVTKEKYDGSLVTQKVTYSGSETVDRWKPGKENTAGDVFIYIFLCLTFVLWAIPYILISLLKDMKATFCRWRIPLKLRIAYKACRENAENADLSFEDKVKFLLSKEKYTSAQEEPTNFSKSYSKKRVSNEYKIPFLYKHTNKNSYMIIDYDRGTYNKYGVSFVLVKDKNGYLHRKMVIGNDYVYSDAENWEIDWVDLGADYDIVINIAYYETVFADLCYEYKNKKTISG